MLSSHGGGSALGKNVECLADVKSVIGKWSKLIVLIAERDVDSN